ncbi:MAG: DHH family phosphoesterase [Candidatus Uhrbacteria bacterium]|nr:DHH family phosphoesterase [Candidatus Uhrbacteria bacterium]
MSRILVTPKVNPDLDGVACALAYAQLLREQGNDTEGIIFGLPQFEVNYFIEQHGIPIPIREDDAHGEWSNFVLVDASSMKGMPKQVIAEKVIEIIDHRAGSPEKDFPNAIIQNELIGAAATLITERYMKAGMMPLPEHAVLLYGAIYHNTLNFITSNTSERDRAAARYLEREYAIDPSIIHDMFLYATRETENDVYRALEQDAKEFGSGGYTIWAFQLQVWGDAIMAQKEKIEESVRELTKKMGCDWAYLNIINLENSTSAIFFTDPIGQQIFSKAFERDFSYHWTHLPEIILRKQIMAKLTA